MNKTEIHSSVRIEVFGPNTSSAKLNKDKEPIAIVQDWNKKGKKNRVQIVIGKQEIPTECLEWAMIKAMEAAGKITVGKTMTDTAAKKAKKTADLKEAKAAKKLAAADEQPAKVEKESLPAAK